MAINIRCPNLKCRKILKVPSSTRGQRACCMYCKKILKVPLAYEMSKAITATPVASDED